MHFLTILQFLSIFCVLSNAVRVKRGNSNELQHRALDGSSTPTFHFARSEPEKKPEADEGTARVPKAPKKKPRAKKKSTKQAQSLVTTPHVEKVSAGTSGPSHAKVSGNPIAYAAGNQVHLDPKHEHGSNVKAAAGMVGAGVAGKPTSSAGKAQAAKEHLQHVEAATEHAATLRLSENPLTGDTSPSICGEIKSCRECVGQCHFLVNDKSEWCDDAKQTPADAQPVKNCDFFNALEEVTPKDKLVLNYLTRKHIITPHLHRGGHFDSAYHDFLQENGITFNRDDISYAEERVVVYTDIKRPRPGTSGETKTKAVHTTWKLGADQIINVCEIAAQHMRPGWNGWVVPNPYGIPMCVRVGLPPKRSRMGGTCYPLDMKVKAGAQTGDQCSKERLDMDS